MPPDPTPSETLRAAAARLRACSPFVLIAGKRIAIEPLAAVLDGFVGHVEGIQGGCDCVNCRPALAFARSILEQP